MNLNFHDFKNLLDSYFYPKNISYTCFIRFFKKGNNMSNLRYIYWSQCESVFLSVRAKDEIKEKEMDLGT